MTTIPSSPVQAQRGTDERERDRLLYESIKRELARNGDPDAIVDCVRLHVRADAETIETLERQKAGYIAARDVYLRGNIELREQLAARSAEVEALRKDAERYRWLRKHEWHNALYSDASLPFIRSRDDLDQSIDAALEEKSRDAD